MHNPISKYYQITRNPLKTFPRADSMNNQVFGSGPFRGFGVDEKDELGFLGLDQLAAGYPLQKGNLLLPVDVDSVLADSGPVLHLSKGFPVVGDF
jgi:hypothetical protein